MGAGPVGFNHSVVTGLSDILTIGESGASEMIGSEDLTKRPDKGDVFGVFGVFDSVFGRFSRFFQKLKASANF